MKTRAPHQNTKSAGAESFGKSIAAAAPRWSENPAVTARRGDDEGSCGLNELRTSSKRGLWSMQLFLVISVAAFLVRDFNLYETLPESVLVILGCPPPPTLAHLALAGYIFTVMTPLVIHMLTGEQPTSSWRHLGYRSAFYAFFLFSNTLTANFIIVFATGIILYLVEQATICFSIAKASHGGGQYA